MSRIIVLLLGFCFVVAQPLDRLRWFEIWQRSQPTQAEVEAAKARQAHLESQICIEGLRELHAASHASMTDAVLAIRNVKHEKQLSQAMKKVKTWCGIK
jgi:head-tail adaptor